LMASGNPFQTVAMAARRVPDDFCGGRSPFSRILVILVLCGQINRPPVNDCDILILNGKYVYFYRTRRMTCRPLRVRPIL
jgi:hypothetical protein